MLVAAVWFLALLQVGQDGRPTLLATASAAPQRNSCIIFQDDAFLFAARHYGDSRDVGGNTKPGLFVQAKKTSRWIRVSAISTAGGTFGTSASADPAAKRKLLVSPVMWDFTPFAQRPYIEQPLRTSASIAFPEHIDYDDRTRRYRLRYLSSWGVPTAETVLYINREHLLAAFAER